jgi:hypothetical protein
MLRYTCQRRGERQERNQAEEERGLGYEQWGLPYTFADHFVR